MDPMAEKYPSWSPYNYILNNLINYIDPGGNQYKVTEKAKSLSASVMGALGVNMARDGSVRLFDYKPKSLDINWGMCKFCWFIFFYKIMTNPSKSIA